MLPKVNNFRPYKKPHNPTPISSLCSLLVLLIPFGILTLLVLPSQAVALSVECEKFCDDKRPSGTTEQFTTHCGVNDSEKIASEKCPGECKKNGCDDSLCPDGISLNCPAKSTQSQRQHETGRYRDPYGNHHRPPAHYYGPTEPEPGEKKPIDTKVVIGVFVGIVVLALIIGAAVVYFYFSYIKKRNLENMTRYQLQAPASAASTRPPPPQPVRDSSKVTVSAHYLAPDGTSVPI